MSPVLGLPHLHFYLPPVVYDHLKENDVFFFTERYHLVKKINLSDDTYKTTNIP